MNSTDSRQHFASLSHSEQVEAALTMLDEGMSEYTVAAACSWSVEYLRHLAALRRVLSERKQRHG